MKQQGQFMLFTADEFSVWLNQATFSRKIKLIQNHHTVEPSYDNFKGNNHFALLEAMKAYHVGTRKFADIAQNLTTFPDGTIAVCRSFETDPAGIKGANKGALCIENLGNFDMGKDVMTSAQKNTIVKLNAMLCNRFSIPADTSHILYHHWYDLNSGERTNGTGTVKTCPGTAFFGGDSVTTADKGFLPLVRAALNMNYEEAVNLLSQKVGIDKNYWLKKKEIDRYFEALMIKIATAWPKDKG